MVCAEVFKKIEELNESYYDVWEQACNLESPTQDKASVDAVGSYFARMAEERGWKVEYCRQAVSGDVVNITLNPDSPEKPLIISGHIDTVHPVGSWGSPAVRRDAEKIYGPGVTDCKGGVVAGFMAMDALWRCGFDKRPVRLLLQTDEEVSSLQSDKATINYICEKAMEGVGFMNLETHTTGFTCTSRKGVATYRFRVEGKEGHASRCVTEGASAVADAAHKIIELEKLKDDNGLTCSCGIVRGGTASNTIPGECIIVANFRFATAQQWEWLENYVRELSETVHVPGCKCTYELAGMRPAMEEVERNMEFLKKANAIFAENGLLELKPRMLRGGSDAADVTAYGGTCLDSLGVRGGGSHTANEYAWLESLAEAAKRVAAVACCI